MLNRKAARARCDAATEGPWHQQALMDGNYTGVVNDDNRIVCKDGWARYPDAVFVANARTDLPAALDLLDKIEALAAEWAGEAASVGAPRCAAEIRALMGANDG